MMIFIVTNCGTLEHEQDSLTIPPHKRSLVLNSVLHPDSTLSAYIDMTGTLDSLTFADDDLVQDLKNAEIILFQDALPFDTLEYYSDTRQPNDLRFFSVGFIPKAFFLGNKVVSNDEKVEWSITVNVPGLEKATSKANIPPRLRTLEHNFRPNLRRLTGPLTGFSEHEVSIKLDSLSETYIYVTIATISQRMLVYSDFSLNIPDQKAYIETNLNPNEYAIATRLWPYSVVSFPSSLVPSIDSTLILRFISDEYRVTNSTGAYNPDLCVVLSISREYHEYLSSSNLQRNLLNIPFAQIPSVSTNVENGVGYFGAINPVIIVPLTQKGEDFLDGRIQNAIN